MAPESTLDERIRVIEHAFLNEQDNNPVGELVSIPNILTRLRYIEAFVTGPPALEGRLLALEEVVERNKERAGHATDEPHITMAQAEALAVRGDIEMKLSALEKEYDDAFAKGRDHAAVSQGVLSRQILEVGEQARELALAAAVAAGKAAAEIEAKLSAQIGHNKTSVTHLQTTVEDVQGSVTVVLSALVTMQRTNMKMLGAAVLIGGVLIFILSRALGF